MPILPKPLPHTALDALQRGIAQTRGLPGAPAAPMLLASGHAAHWTDGLPQESFHLGLDDVTAQRGLDAARPTGWHVLLGAPSELPSVAADLHAADGGHNFAGLHFGPFVGRSLDAFRAAEAHPTVRGAEYEPRLLRVPALFVTALWLKPRAAGADIVIPLDPAPSGLVVGRHYTATEFMNELATLGRAMGAAPPSPSPTSPHAP